MSTPKLDKTYNWNKLEERWYQHWLDSNYFQGKTVSKEESYSIVIPPPNVTGILTMGHVLNNTIQDVLIRKARMEGKMFAGFLELTMHLLQQNLRSFKI